MSNKKRIAELKKEREVLQSKLHKHLEDMEPMRKIEREIRTQIKPIQQEIYDLVME